MLDSGLVMIIEVMVILSVTHVLVIQHDDITDDEIIWDQFHTHLLLEYGIIWYLQYDHHKQNYL